MSSHKIKEKKCREEENVGKVMHGKLGKKEMINYSVHSCAMRVVVSEIR